jgi:golgi-specific brefeldin A-resistance guanine nucleotide exchange factor 1
MPIEAIRSIVDSLLAQLPEEESPRVMVVKPDLPPPSPVRPNGQRSRINAPVYDPAVVFVLEFATLLCLRDEETVHELGMDVADALRRIVRNSANVHYIVISRAVYYLLRLLQASQVSTIHSVCISKMANDGPGLQLSSRPPCSPRYLKL